MAEDAVLEVLHVEERSSDIRTHYNKLADLIAKPNSGLDPEGVVSIAKSIACWQDALAGGDITWTCFVARKPA